MWSEGVAKKFTAYVRMSRNAANGNADGNAPRIGTENRFFFKNIFGFDAEFTARNAFLQNFFHGNAKSNARSCLVLYDAG